MASAGGFASSDFKPGQLQQQDGQTAIPLHEPNSTSKAADGAQIHLQDSTHGSEAPAVLHALSQRTAAMTDQIHQAVIANPAAPSVTANGISSCRDLEASAAASAPAEGRNGSSSVGWWPSWLRPRGGSHAARRSGSFSRSRGGSGGGHSSGGLSLQHSSSSRLMVDSEKGLAGVHRHRCGYGGSALSWASATMQLVASAAVTLEAECGRRSLSTCAAIHHNDNINIK
jgi:hypothetical protein